MEKVTAALERLEGLLAEKDDELEKAQTRIEQLEREIEGSLNGWRTAEKFEDDGELPVPRLELVYRPRSEDWSDYVVIYRIVAKHLLGYLVGTPLGRTVVQGGYGYAPSDHDLPFREGAHARHDSGHWGIPLYKVMPDRKPFLVVDEDDSHYTMGLKHRRRHS